MIINNDTRPDSPHRMILDLIPSGRDNAVTRYYLADMTGSSLRDIHRMIEHARIDGNIIAGTNEGLFIPENEHELRDYINRTLSKIDTTIKTLNPALELTGRSVRMVLRGDDNV